MSVEIQIYYMGVEGFADEPEVTKKIKVSEDRNPFGFGDVNGDGMTDFVVVEHSHAFMMRMRRPIELTIRFLQTGAFENE